MRVSKYYVETVGDARVVARWQILRSTTKNCAANLEMICADFLAGANLDNPDLLLHSISRSFKFLRAEQQQAFVAHALEKAS